MHDVYIQIVPDMPSKLNGLVMEMEDGTYTVMFQDIIAAKKAFNTRDHEFDHIIYCDFEGYDADEIERLAHQRQSADHSSIFIINDEIT